MAKGRRDYTWGVLQDTIQPGLYSSNFKYAQSVTLAAGANGNAISYTVPDGYKLFLLGAIYTCKNPGINMAVLGPGSGVDIVAYFDTRAEFNLGSYGGIPYIVPSILNVHFYNYDTQQQVFYAMIYGILEELV